MHIYINIDTFGSSVLSLLRVLVGGWSVHYQLAQDAYMPDLQPVEQHSLLWATLFFHIFLLCGSIFGLNLFAGFMCDTFYSLQGTEQLEEVQWLSVRQVLG